ncbi:ABC transporter ATPase [Mucilaginibacter terrae]|uniref:ABC transporter ATPase n=1 Tax=Mucilaginibacter terrae TaxID=1955052 RepID=UPI0036322573
MQFSENSRVWIYQSNKELTANQTAQLQNQLSAFAQNWTAHNNQLKATAIMQYNRFILLVVDENQAGASGCSIDKSVRFMKDLENEYQINLFDRFNLAYRNGEQITSVSRNEFEDLIKAGTITENTIVFNNLVQTLAELQTKWEVPLKDSWHIQLFGNLLVN